MYNFYIYLAHNSNCLGKLFKGLTLGRSVSLVNYFVLGRRSVSLVNYFVEALNQSFNQTE